MRHLLIATVALVLAGPLLGLAIVTILIPGATATCTSTATAVGTVPASLDAVAGDGAAIRLDRRQLEHAATIITVGSQIPDVGRDGLLVALMAALTESRLLMYANTSAYPQSATFPHDADGSDHDSLGLFQMRPAAGWGTVAQLMDPAYQARAFFGGPAGPNHGSPRGLLDVPDWRALPKGAAAQTVEVSAYPDRYARFEPVARTILKTLTNTPPTVSPANPGPAARTAIVRTLPSVIESTFPLPAETWTRTSGFGVRQHPTLGIRRLHAGVDLAAPAGTPVFAISAGRVAVAEHSGGLGNHVILEHRIDNSRLHGGSAEIFDAKATDSDVTVASVYGHMLDGSLTVQVGDLVTAGQHLGNVGSTGNSSGPHLHFEIRPGGARAPAVDPAPWLAAATEVADATPAASREPSTCQAMTP